MSTEFGLEEVETDRWGGLMLTMVIAITGIVASLPLGIMLALGRQSDMPIVRLFSVIFIEGLARCSTDNVYCLCLRFCLPLFLPDGVTFDKLLRALIGVALFSAAYMAEVVRGGLQAIPKGQYEGAMAVGLSFWQSMRMIILPQALKIVIPGIVNTFHRPVQRYNACIHYRAAGCAWYDQFIPFRLQVGNAGTSAYKLFVWSPAVLGLLFHDVSIFYLYGKKTRHRT